MHMRPFFLLAAFSGALLFGAFARAAQPTFVPSPTAQVAAPAPVQYSVPAGTLPCQPVPYMTARPVEGSAFGPAPAGWYFAPAETPWPQSLIDFYNE